MARVTVQRCCKGMKLKRLKGRNKKHLDEIITWRFYSRYVASDEIQNLQVRVGGRARGATELGALESPSELEI